LIDIYAYYCGGVVDFCYGDVLILVGFNVKWRLLRSDDGSAEF
jgi:hypothetical protein